jgi:hypothetical protein
MVGWTLLRVDKYICTKANMLCGWVVDPDQSPIEEENIIWEESAKFTDFSSPVACGRITCSQTSHYRLP